MLHLGLFVILTTIISSKSCRGQPPDYILRIAKNTDKFFKRIGSIHHFEDDEPFNGGRSSYKLLTEEEYEAVSLNST